MRVLQLIDSLRPGGAEKMAVNIANGLVPHVEGSYLCCTRQEGMLKDELKPEVGYLFLNKKSRLDPKAILSLRKFIIRNKINLVHSHSTSFFLASILKLTGARFKLIWHNHYGATENFKEMEFQVLKFFSRYFSGIISVNTVLNEWAIKNLDCENTTEVKNFIPIPEPAIKTKLQLKGKLDDLKIICVANLRPDKDLFNLLRAFEMLKPDLNVSLHLIGGDPGTKYSASVLNRMKNSPLNHQIFYYGTQPNINSLLKQSNIGVLSSRSEGLPIALLEYGVVGLPVICTDVGKCKDVVKGDGRVVQKENPEELAKEMLFYITHSEKRIKDAQSLQQRIIANYSEKEVILALLDIYKNW